MYLRLSFRALTGGILCLTLLGLSGCDDDDDGTGPVRLSDGQVVAIAIALDQGEVVTSEPALVKAVSAAVIDFAGELITDYSANIEEFDELGITPVPNAISTDLNRIADQVEDILDRLSGIEYDRAYLDAQIELHLLALDLIDNLLLPEASDEALRVELQTMRALVREHLLEAEQISIETG